jgi:hypothetical protein
MELTKKEEQILQALKSYKPMSKGKQYLSIAAITLDITLLVILIIFFIHDGFHFDTFFVALFLIILFPLLASGSTNTQNIYIALIFKLNQRIQELEGKK